MSSALAKSVYNDKRWAPTREAALARDGRRCRECGRPAKTAHHRPAIERLIALGISPFDLQYVFTLCHHCHGVEDGQRAHPPKPAKVNRFAPWLSR